MNILDFPLDPDDGQLYPLENVSFGDIQYIWSSNVGAWLKTTKTITIDAAQIVSGIINPNRLPSQNVLLIQEESELTRLNAISGDIAYLEQEKKFFVLIRNPSSIASNWASINSTLSQEELDLIESMIIKKIEAVENTTTTTNNLYGFKYSLAWL